MCFHVQYCRDAAIVFCSSSNADGHIFCVLFWFCLSSIWFARFSNKEWTIRGFNRVQCRKLHLNWSIEHYLPIICSELINDRESMKANEHKTKKNTATTHQNTRRWTKKETETVTLVPFSRMKSASKMNTRKEKTSKLEIKCDKMKFSNTSLDS